MAELNPEFVVDKEKRTKSVILPFAEWEKVMEELEELDDIRAYDQTKMSTDERVPFDQAVREIRKDYKAY